MTLRIQKLLSTIGLLLACNLATNYAKAQTITYSPSGPVVVPSTAHHSYQRQIQVGDVVYLPPGHSSSYGYYTSRPQYPLIVTPNQVTGVNQTTGGLNTSNLQIDNTYFDPYRNLSMNNGTRRWVQRPIYDHFGNVVGYQEGFVWNNSLTGQEHGVLTNHTPNSLGGVNSQTQVKSRIHHQR